MSTSEACFTCAGTGHYPTSDLGDDGYERVFVVECPTCWGHGTEQPKPTTTHLMSIMGIMDSWRAHISLNPQGASTPGLRWALKDMTNQLIVMGVPLCKECGDIKDGADPDECVLCRLKASVLAVENRNG